MNQSYAIVEESGAINSVYASPYLFIPCEPGLDDDHHYYDHKDETLKERKEVTVTTHISGLTVVVEGIPPGMLVEANGNSTLSDQDPLEVAFDVPGTYTIHLSGLVEYRERVLEVTVGDS